MFVKKEEKEENIYTKSLGLYPDGIFSKKWKGTWNVLTGSSRKDCSLDNKQITCLAKSLSIIF